MRRSAILPFVVISCVLISLASAGPQDDWLVARPVEPARVVEHKERNEISLENGLLRRVFVVDRGGATVALDNLTTGTSMLRGVKPEMIVRIDGREFEVGGLTGQPNYAFLLDEWLDGMKANEGAFQLVDYRIGKTEAPFKWRRVRHSQDLPWPPPGTRLTMNYRLSPDAVANMKGNSLPSEFARELLLDEPFGELTRLTAEDSPWSLKHSDREEGISTINEGKPGEIFAPANCFAYIERELPKGVRLVECRLHAGTDQSASWGPGVAMFWPGRTIRFHLRPGEKRFGVTDGGREHLLGSCDVERSNNLRIRIDGERVVCESSIDGKNWVEIYQAAAPNGEPTLVRLGKTDRSGGASDYGGIADKWGRSRIESFRAFGPIDEKKLAENEALTASYLSKLTLSVVYELYDGIPLIAKWFTLRNDSDRPVTIDGFTTERLAVVEGESTVEPKIGEWRLPDMHVESEYEFHGMDAKSANETVRWLPDPQYMTQVNYRRVTPCMLEVENNPVDQTVVPGETFTGPRVFELLFDSTDREHRGLAMRRMYRTLAPWCTENPLMMHVRSASESAVRLAVDQCADVGFEMVILTFGSGFNIENDSPEYLSYIKRLTDYAHEKGVELGGYSLLSSRRVSDADDVVNPETGRPGGFARFGNAPCLESEWGQRYFDKLYKFFETTGADLLEHDGSYPGDVCASTTHPGHRGLGDSQFNQWKKIATFYRWCRERGVFLNVPDFYYFNGSNKCGMGYRETNWSLPRAQQIIHGRQNIYDGTWAKTPSMGWMFVPLTQYHGGGAAATMEPLSANLADYERHIANCLGAGVQACYRGPRLYDTEATREVVKRWVDFYKRHRAILESDIIHLRRADGRHIDYLLHVGPSLEEKGLLMVYNPLDRPVEKTITVPLYYSGLDKTTRVTANDDRETTETLEIDREWNVKLDVIVPAGGCAWYVFEEGDR